MQITNNLKDYFIFFQFFHKNKNIVNNIFLNLKMRHIEMDFGSGGQKPQKPQLYRVCSVKAHAFPKDPTPQWLLQLSGAV